MPRGNWRYVVAALVGLICVAASPPQDQTGQGGGHPQQSPRGGEGVAPWSPEKSDEASDEKKPCEPGDDNRKSELCAQWKAADAAAEATIWARRTFWLGAGGFVVGLLTFAAAAIAAKGAWDAAIHTKTAAEIARRTFSELQRPWVFLTIDGIRMGNDEAGHFVEVTFAYKNAGGSPALIDRHSAGFYLFNDVPDAIHSFPEPLRWDRVLPAGGKTEALTRIARRLQINRMKDLHEGRVRLGFSGSIHYRAVNNDPGLTTFFMPYDPRQNAFLPEGEEHNRHT